MQKCVNVRIYYSNFYLHVAPWPVSPQDIALVCETQTKES